MRLHISFNTGEGIMVNATQMAKPFGKKPVEFLSMGQTKEFIRVLESKVGISTLETKRGGTTPGTWMHQKLALKFAGWLNPEFELWVFDRIEELLKNGYTQADQSTDGNYSINPNQLLGSTKDYTS